MLNASCKIPCGGEVSCFSLQEELNKVEEAVTSLRPATQARDMAFNISDDCDPLLPLACPYIELKYASAVHFL